MKITLDLTPEMTNALQRRTQEAIEDMAKSGYDFSDWTPELEATTILRKELIEGRT